MATTPCPTCHAAIVVRGERGTCKSCGQAVRFVDAPSLTCLGCAASVPVRPGRAAARCPACGAWTAVDSGRPVEGQVTCPRCRRSLAAPLDAQTLDCRHCGSRLALRDTL